LTEEEVGGRGEAAGVRKLSPDEVDVGEVEVDGIASKTNNLSNL
jgi:hypothetical protein